MFNQTLLADERRGALLTHHQIQLTLTFILFTTFLQVGCNPKSEILPEMDFSYQIQETSLQELSGIIAGQPVSSEDTIASSTVMIIDAENGENYCTGTLISKNLVLTAAHCTSENPRSIKIGFSKVVPGIAQDVPTRQVVSGMVHPNWPKLSEEVENNWGDIAVLRFEGSVPEGYSPARILSQREALQNGRPAILAGFGDLNKTPVLPASRLMRAEVVISNAAYSETEILFEQHQGRGACHGDSGGPAFLPLKDRHVVFGVTSRSATAEGAQTCLHGSVYTSTAAVMDFIRGAASALNKSHIPQKIPQPKF